MRRGRTRVGRIVAAHVMKETARAPLMSLLMLGALTVSFILGELPASLEGFYSYPFVHMNSSYIAELQCPDGIDGSKSLANLELPPVNARTLVCDRALIRAGDKAAPARVIAVHHLSGETLSKTEFNPGPLQMGSVNSSSVIVDKSLAETLGVKEGQSIVVYREGEKKTRIKVTNTMLPYASTRGVLVDDSLLPALHYDSIALYTDSVQPDRLKRLAHRLDSEDGDYSVVSKDERIAYERQLGRSVLPYIKNGFMVWFALAIALAGFTVYALACLKAGESSVYKALEIVGTTRVERAAVFLFGKLCTGAILCLIGALLEDVILKLIFYRWLMPMELVASVLLGLVACACGTAVAVAVYARKG